MQPSISKIKKNQKSIFIKNNIHPTMSNFQGIEPIVSGQEVS